MHHSHTHMLSTPLVIPHLAPGERVAAELLVYDRAEKKTNNGDPFIVLTLGNSTGRIETAPIWSDKLEWADGVRSDKGAGHWRCDHIRARRTGEKAARDR